MSKPKPKKGEPIAVTRYLTYVDDFDDNAEPYEPKPAEVAGFDLCAWKVKGGIQLGADKGRGPIMPAFPSRVRVLDMIYTLEAVEWQSNGFGWGLYV